ncbi:LacI family DNA-binding transcriptional regulator [candidate division KSB3 bacterium]|nr:LacI family DNA-binding transcriptional regulator [candidate division KSB3 bacterium]
MAAKKKTTTLSDVAKYAGVSIKTVSNVVNDWPYVSDETRKKVQDAIQVTGYRPNQMARSLITGQTKSIGIIIQDISNPFFGLAIRGCEDVLYNNGYSQFLCSASEDIERERYYLDVLVSRAVDAVIIWGSRLAGEELQTRLGKDLPFVTVDYEGEPIGKNHTIVNVNNVNGAEAATRHLIRQGYLTIAHLASSLGRITCQRRLMGYRQALEASGIPYEPHLIQKGQPSISGGYRATLELLKTRNPDAIFCYNDLMAVGAILALQYLDRQVPDDVAVVGFDDIMAASMIDPPLTTMRIAQYELGKLTGELVLERLKEGICCPKSQIYPVELQVRGSCGAVQFTRGYKHHLVEHVVSSFAVDFPNGLSPE